MNERIKKLVADVSLKCIKNNISLRLENKHLVDMDNLPCSGYFDESSLVVATKKSKVTEWVTTLLHESCHMDQYLEKSKVYVPDKDALNIVEGWINKKSMNKERLVQGFKNTILLELDCEQRTVKKIKKYGLNISIVKYVQEANAYLFSYLYALDERTWYKAPYENDQIVKNMPRTFLSIDDYFNNFKNYKKYFTKKALKNKKQIL